ncbi:MAG: amidohydrolase family protein [Gemmataceae bacterium]
MESRIFTARWVFPVSGPPLERGTVSIRGDRIESVLPHGERTAEVDLGNVALVPGLVNPHTHLDLSGARGLIPPTDPDHFTDWLRGVIAYRRSRSAEQVQADIRAGLAECLRHGTTLIGDIAAEGASWDAASEAKTRAVVFWEMIGVTEPRAVAAVETARQWFDSRSETTTCRAGLSPHSPYSARWNLFPAAGQIVRVKKRPTAIHLAEWRAEIDLLASRRGPLIPFLQELGVWDQAGLIESITGVMKGCDQRQPKLFIHGNHLAPTTRIPRNSTIVYCPRTHAAFGHHPHPFREFLQRGVRVCLGTDSLASNPDLDILAEARFVHAKYPDFPCETLLWMITLSGAEALGWASEAGSLEPGKSADFVTIPLPNVDTEPHELLFANHPGDRRTMFRGEWR